MPATLALPRPLDEALAQEAQRDGVSATERATLLLYLAHALVSEGEPTPFQEAVRLFLARHSLDPDQVGSALEELLKLCLAEEQGQQFLSLRTALDALAQGDLTLLTQWRNALVHGVKAEPEAALSTDPPGAPRSASAGDEGAARDQERDPEIVARVRSLRGTFARPGSPWASEELHRERQADKVKEESQVQERRA